MQADRLHRKQYLMSTSNIQKIEAIVQTGNAASAAEVVRAAVEAYDSATLEEDVVTPEVVEFLSGQLAAAIASVRETNVKVESLLKTLEGK